MTFRDDEKARYESIKFKLFSKAACQPGVYRGISRSFCLQNDCSTENLYVEFRRDALTYFRTRAIGWHDGLLDRQGNKKGLPSNHLCCSQSSCVNCLWPMTTHPGLLASVFRPFFPELAEGLPITADDPLPDGTQPYLAFEWIGKKGSNYLNEIGNRARGANATSADFAFRFQRHDGRIQLVLGEWKYTEHYLAKQVDTNPTRRRIHREHFEQWQKQQPLLPEYSTFFIEPFYQLMRLTLLAQAMERARAEGEGEMGADLVSVLVVAPKANRDYTENFTTPALAQFGRTIGAAWAYLAPPDRFLAIATESLLTTIEQVAPEPLHAWRNYVLTRYGWWRTAGPTQ